MYGEPDTAAEPPPPPPLTANVTDPTDSPFCRPLGVNCVLPLPKLNVAPYILLCALAVMVRGAWLTVRLPLA